MRAHFAYKPLRGIAHPDIDYIGAAEILLTYRRKRVTQAIGGSIAVAEQHFEQLVLFPVRTLKYKRFIPIDQIFRLFRYRDFFVFDFK